MIDIISQYRLGLVEKYSRLFRTSTSVDDLLQQIGIVAASGFDEELFGGGSLQDSVSLLRLLRKGCEYSQGECWPGVLRETDEGKHTSCSISCSG